MFSSAAPPSSIHNAEFQSPETSIFAVNNRRRQHMKLLFLPLTFPHPNPLQSTKISCLYKPPNPKPYTSRIRSKPYRSRIRSSTPTPTPPRDVVIDFGKHKGKMLGSLPSAYLKWISKNLISADFYKWAKLADLVLEDPIYRDRIEWEFAHRIMTGDGKGTGEDLLELSERFGWDWHPNARWGKPYCDLELLGTSFGGRLPRLGDRVEREAPAKRGKASAAAVDGETSGRERRRERMRSKRGERSSAGRSRVARLGNINGENDSDDEEADENRAAEVAPPKRFPGRPKRFPGREEADDENRAAEVAPPKGFPGREEADENRAAEVAPPNRFPGRESLWKKSLWKKVIEREKLL